MTRRGRRDGCLTAGGHSRVIAGLAAVLWALSLSPAIAAPGPLLRIADPRITEASGIAAGIASPGVMYVHNDSGDAARFFALDATSGATLAEYDVPGATNVDWEDVAVARDARGVPSVWLADIGDNGARRGEVRLYRVDEPRVDRARRDVRTSTAAADVWRLRYPDGPRDAESLAVVPGGRAYLFGKSLSGVTPVYALPPAPGAGVATMRRVGTVTLRFTGTPGGPNPFGQLTATGAAVSADGSLLALRSYTDAYLWRLDGARLEDALTRQPQRIALPEQQQGEGIAIRGDQLLLDSEGADSPVFAVPVPTLPTLPNPSRSPAPSSSGRGGRPAPAGSATRADRPVHPARTGLYLAVGAAVAGLAGLSLRAARTRRGARRVRGRR